MDKNEIHKSVLEKSSVSFARSGGKGGQNVNKVNTKVHISISLDEISGISETEKEKLKSKLKSAINSQNEIFLDADDERFQGENRKIALERLENKIFTALKTRKKRIRTKPTKSSVEKRLKLKKIRADRKKSRKRNFDF